MRRCNFSFASSDRESHILRSCMAALLSARTIHVFGRRALFGQASSSPNPVHGGVYLRSNAAFTVHRWKLRKNITMLRRCVVYGGGMRRNDAALGGGMVRSNASLGWHGPTGRMYGKLRRRLRATSDPRFERHTLQEADGWR